MKSPFILALITCSAVFLQGCATGPRFADAQASIPPLATENGRIYLYRTSVLGAAIQPAVKLNDEQIGTAKPQGFFYTDRPPGNYHIDSTTEVKRRLSLTLDRGQTRYVRLNVAMGFFAGHIFPELVEQPVGEKEIAGCKFTGKN